MHWFKGDFLHMEVCTLWGFGQLPFLKNSCSSLIITHCVCVFVLVSFVCVSQVSVSVFHVLYDVIGCWQTLGHSIGGSDM